MTINLLSKLLACFAFTGVLFGQTSNYRILQPPHPYRDNGMGFGQIDPGLAGSSDLWPAVGGRGYSVAMGKGDLSMVIPVATVPGEIPIDVAYRFNGTRADPVVLVGIYQSGTDGSLAATPGLASGTSGTNTVSPLMGTGGHNGYYPGFLNLHRPVFGTVDFGFISSSDIQYVPGTDFDFPGKLGRFSPYGYIVLEDGRVLSSVMDFSTMTGTFSLPPLFGFAAKAASAVSIDTSGTLVNYPAVATDLGSWASMIVAPAGFTASSHTGYQVVMDRDRARVYAYATELYAWVPVLWIDRFGHWVTFKWQNVTTGLPTGFAAVRTVTATNHRGMGVQVQWAEPTAGNSAPEQILLRADFINLQAPTLQAKGYADLATGGYYSMLPLSGGPVFRPTQLEIGNPDMALPAPNWTVLLVPQQVPNPEPWPTSDRLWEFAYNSIAYPSDQLKAFTDDLGLTTTVTWTPTSLLDPNAFSQGAAFPLDSYDSVGTLSATDSGVTLTQGFTWNLPTTTTATSWTTTYRKTFAGTQGWNNQPIASADNPTMTYTFYPPSDPKYGNAALQQLQVTVGSTVLSTQTYTYATGLGTNGSAQGPQEIDTNTEFDPLAREVFTLDTTTGSILSHFRTVRSYQDQLTFTYDRHPEYLDPNRRILVVNANVIGPTTISTREEDAVFDPATFLPTQATKGSSSGKIGSSFTYVTSPGNTMGHLQTVVPYASGSLFSAPPAGGERTTTLTLDPKSALPTKASTSYYGPSGYLNSFTQEAYVYDSADRNTSYMDGLGATIGTSYDAWGRLAGTTHSGQASVAITYPSMLQIVTQRNGQTDTLNTNAFGLRTVHARGSDGVTEMYSYDLNGQIVAVQETSPAGKTRSCSRTLDGLGRLLSTVPIVGPTVSYAYSADTNGNRILNCSYSGQTFTTSRTMDIWGNVVSDTDPYGTVTTRAFDSYGRVTASTTTPGVGNPQTRTYTYTDWGLATRQDPETGLTNYGQGLYNVLGQPNTIVENDGRTRTMTYDGLGRLRSATSGSDSVGAGYNGLFLAFATTTGSNLTSSVVYTPDSIGRVSQEAVTYPGLASPRTISYGYDPADGCRLGSITYPEGGIVGYSYGDDSNNYGRLIKVNFNGQLLTTVGYDQEGWGHLGSVAFNGPSGSGASNTWDYSSDGTQIKSETIYLPGEAAIVRSYGYDALNHFNQAGEWTSLTHDVLGRLTQATYLGASVSLQSDGFDNNISSQAGAAPGFNNFTFNPLPTNREPGTATNGAITGWTYDGDGEALSLGASIGQGALQLVPTWDKLGRVASVSMFGQIPTYAYLPNGCRAQVMDGAIPANNRQYLYSSSGTLLGEYTQLNSSWNWKRSIIYAGGLAIAEWDGQGVHELHTDHLGTPLVVTRAGVTGAEGSQFFGPYGEALPSFYSANGTYRPLTGFTGHIQTEPNGLIYMRGRFYSPAWHCFLNPDGGADSNQWSQYAYCGGNPMMNVDPSGMSWLSDVWHELVHHPGRLLCDPLSITADWNKDRQAVEVGAAVVACILIDIYAPEMAGSDNEIISAIGGAAQAAGPATSNAVIGGVAGGAIGGTWRSAAQGMMAGYCLGMGYSSISAGMAAGNAGVDSGGGYWDGFFNGNGGFDSVFRANMTNIFGPQQNLGGYGMSVFGSGVVNEALANGGTPWNNFRNGLELGAVMGGAGYQFSPQNGALLYLADQGAAQGIYNAITGRSGFTSTFENGLLWGAFGVFKNPQAGVSQGVTWFPN